MASSSSRTGLPILSDSNLGPPFSLQNETDLDLFFNLTGSGIQNSGVQIYDGVLPSPLPLGTISITGVGTLDQLSLDQNWLMDWEAAFPGKEMTTNCQNYYSIEPEHHNSAELSFSDSYFA